MDCLTLGVAVVLWCVSVFGGAGVGVGMRRNAWPPRGQPTPPRPSITHNREERRERRQDKKRQGGREGRCLESTRHVAYDVCLVY